MVYGVCLDLIFIFEIWDVPVLGVFQVVLGGFKGVSGAFARVLGGSESFRGIPFAYK